MGAIFLEYRKQWVEEASLRRWHFLFFAFLLLSVWKLEKLGIGRALLGWKTKIKTQKNAWKMGALGGFEEIPDLIQFTF